MSNAVHDAVVPSPNSPKASGVNGPKVPLPFQKKLQTLEQMKEELRKKQEMLEFNNFGKLLQSGGVKGDLPTEQAAKRQKVGVAADPATTPSVSEPGASSTIPCTVWMTDKNNSTDNIASQGPTSNTTLSLQECKSSKQQSHPSAVGHLHLSKYKLDNRPTAFSVIPSLPSGLPDVDVLKEHFLQYGDLSAVELEDVENDDGDMVSKALDNCSVFITYGIRRSAEKAYTNEGKLACNISPGVLASGNKGSKSSEGVEHMELPQVLEHNSSPSSSVKKSLKGDGC
ncbi:hypothetical protein V6N12_045082 [Hibiscus sabdariffa]|uniref:RRM domain-containing protein n=1 Tax=Hibiscus sabdariffa TaxID=183260 RepID=A0ABR2G1S6_9ROSI